jgi:hypothetical protein
MYEFYAVDLKNGKRAGTNQGIQRFGPDAFALSGCRDPH